MLHKTNPPGYANEHEMLTSPAGTIAAQAGTGTLREKSLLGTVIIPGRHYWKILSGFHR